MTHIHYTHTHTHTLYTHVCTCTYITHMHWYLNNTQALIPHILILAYQTYTLHLHKHTYMHLLHLHTPPLICKYTCACVNTMYICTGDTHIHILYLYVQTIYMLAYISILGIAIPCGNEYQLPAPIYSTRQSTINRVQ